MTRSLLYKSVFILAMSSLLSRGIGVVRDALLAAKFGAGGEGIFNLDIYYSAFRIPDFVYSVLIMGAISASFVPILTHVMDKKRASRTEVMTEDANLFTSNVLNTVFMALLIFSAAAFIFAPYIVQFLVPGFDSLDATLTVKVTRLILISPVFLGLSAVLQSVQNAFDKFFYYSLAPIFYNLGIIFGIVFFAESYGVWGVAVGVILGAFLHFLIQLPGASGLHFRYRFYISWKDSYLREMIRLVIPRIVGMSIMQVNLIFDTMVGSLLAGGSITVLNYAVNLNSLPMGTLGISFAVASFATLSSLAIRCREKFSDELSRTITSICYFVIPAGVGLFVLRFDVVDLILGYGEFTEKDVILTGNTLAFLLIGLLGQSLVPVFARAFYAFKNTMIPVLIGIVCMALNIGLNFYFALNIGLGVYGIALATGLTSLLNMFLLIVFLKLKFLPGMKCIAWKRVGAIIFASAVMGAAVYFVDFAVSVWAAISLINQILALSVSIAIGVIVFVFSILPFHLEETEAILSRVGLKTNC